MQEGGERSACVQEKGERHPLSSTLNSREASLIERYCEDSSQCRYTVPKTQETHLRTYSIKLDQFHSLTGS